jgi:hypothetical protein
LPAFCVLIISQLTVLSQSCYHPFVDSIISKTSLQSVSRFSRELTGDTTTVIGGLPYRIISRMAFAPGNEKAGRYIYEKFQSYNLQAEYHAYTSTGANVIGKKTGIKYPYRKYIICAHYDNCTWQTPMPDTIPGADDNASGVSAVLEAARILSQYDFENTILFIALDEEESASGGTWGSGAYADTARLNGDTILGVINLDMIGWDGNNDNIFQITANQYSEYLADIVVSSANVYTPVLKPIKHFGVYGSDQIAFWDADYKAVASHEDMSDFHPYYHTVNDTYSRLNQGYMINIIKNAIAALVVLEKGYIIDIIHNPLENTFDTTAREVKAVIKSKSGIASGNNSPRLYFKTGNGLYDWRNSVYHNLDTFKFIIPGVPKGGKVAYYLAAQDSLGVLSGSIPAGVKGTNPPGTTPPPYPFEYSILNSFTISSVTVPKPISTLNYTNDTIFIFQPGIIDDIDINLTLYHSNDSNITVYFKRLDMNQITLSNKNGGSGDNYVNTTFDDEAAISITQGTPPFTGAFKPMQPLNILYGKAMNTAWVLRILNASPNVTGELVNWSLNIKYHNPIGIISAELPMKFSLSQNYPNPFNPNTKINFSVLKEADIRIVVYDVLGREIRMLINAKYKSGSYTAELNGGELASGLYFYSMYIDGVLFETKKMILMK